MPNRCISISGIALGLCAFTWWWGFRVGNYSGEIHGHTASLAEFARVMRDTPRKRY